ncbi:unnamed protein product [Trifolium pratense]|uniref:Uncharacterized protein n=1 Tax=Trifolium pratense TaxID=57577 RepID=A0ACB0K5X5_TRIPR|nr:unnamed protein product [Trifolium pratense]
MNPYDFYYLEDFLKFSPFSPNHGNLNMVSSPRFRSSRIRPASAIVPIPENPSIAYHKEIYTVLFDPPSFLMVHSIYCHLWKKSKMEKKFLPLPPLRKSPQESSIHVQELLSDSIPEAEGEISSPSTSVLVSSTRFGNFHSEIVLIKSIEFVKPEIKDCTVKIGKITCTLVDSSCSIESAFSASEENEKLKNLDLLNQEAKVEEKLQKFKPQTSNHKLLSEISFSAIDRFVDVFIEQDLVSPRLESIEHSLAIIVEVLESRNSIFPVSAANHFEHLDLYGILDTVFDPGGVVTPLSVKLLYGAMIFVSPSTFGLLIVFVVEFSVEFIVLVFDPGGNRHRSQLKSLTTILTSEEKHTQVSDSESPSSFIDSELKLASELKFASQLNLASGIPSDTTSNFCIYHP